MPAKISDRLTSVARQDFINALGWCWGFLLESTPTKEQLLVLMAQSALECGWWNYCHNYNLGNVKSAEGDDRDYTYFACNEVLKTSVAKAYEADSTGDKPCKITSTDTVAGTSTVWFYPEHPAARFRAYLRKNQDGTVDEYGSLLLGMLDYLGLLHNRFGSAWPAVLSGDPRKFVQTIKSLGYFTAQEKPYEDAVASIYRTLVSSTTFDITSLPEVTDDQAVDITALSILVSGETRPHLQTNLASYLKDALRK